MSALEREKTIRAQRTIDAVRNNLMGVGGKLGVILRYLGQPLRQHGCGMHQASSLDDYLGEPYWTHADEFGEEDGVQEADPYETIRTIGYMFDGLSRGMWLEIVYKLDESTIRVLWKGYEVYREEAGELEAYVPSREWEDCIDRLYEQAKQRGKVEKQQEQVIKEERGRQAKEGFIAHLRRTWGF